MIDYRRDPDAEVPECAECDARLNEDGNCDECHPDEAVFDCDWCHEIIDEDDLAPNTFEQMGTSDNVCIWCAQDSGHYVSGLSYD